MINIGDKVMTPGGPGIVVYRRMKGPEYIEPIVYSVKLDSKDHTGTIYSVDDVKLVEPCDK